MIQKSPSVVGIRRSTRDRCRRTTEAVVGGFGGGMADRNVSQLPVRLM